MSGDSPRCKYESHLQTCKLCCPVWGSEITNSSYQRLRREPEVQWSLLPSSRRAPWEGQLPTASDLCCGYHILLLCTKEDHGYSHMGIVWGFLVVLQWIHTATCFFTSKRTSFLILVKVILILWGAIEKIRHRNHVLALLSASDAVWWYQRDAKLLSAEIPLSYICLQKLTPFQLSFMSYRSI